MGERQTFGCQDLGLLSQALLQLSFFPLYINPLTPPPLPVSGVLRTSLVGDFKPQKKHLAPFFSLGHLSVCPH